MCVDRSARNSARFNLNIQNLSGYIHNVEDLSILSRRINGVAVARWIALHDPLIIVLQGNQVQSEHTAIVEESPGC